jgi:hypothetical protein
LKSPTSVRVPAGHRSAGFPITAKLSVGSAYTATLIARLNGSRSTRRLDVTPGLRFVEIPQSSVPNDVGLNIGFTGALTSAGATVKLKSSSPAVTVPATARFDNPASGGEVAGIVVHPVTKRTPVTISVTYGRRTLTTAKRVLVPPADPGNPTGAISVQDSETPYGTSHLQYDVHLDAPAPDPGFPVQWQIQGDDPAAEVESPTGFIGQGSETDSTFVSFADVTSAHQVVLEAIVGTTTFQLPITVQPRVTDIVLPDTVVGGQDFIGTVTLAGPASVDTDVSLEPSWGVIDVQPSVTIPAGQTSAQFIGSSTTVDADSPVTVSGLYGGPSVQSGFMTVTP